MTSPTTAQRHSELNDLLTRAQAAYHDRETPEMDDATYDALMGELRAIENANPELPRIASKHVGADQGGQNRHPSLMQSLGNAYNEQDVQDFLNKLNRSLALNEQTPHEMTVEYKLDGLSANLIYQEGQFLRAATRGNGESGEDITAQMRLMGIPERVAAQGTLEVRGEIYMPRSVMDAHNERAAASGERVFKHTRNAAVGSLRKGTAERVSLLRFAPYGLGERGTLSDLGIKSQHDALLWLGMQGFKTVTRTTIQNATAAQLWQAHRDMEAQRGEMDFDADGTVIKLSSFAAQTEAGRNSQSPTWATAIKFEAVTQTTTLLDVTFGVGRTGAVTPTAVLAPVTVEGSTITSATLHNSDYLQSLGLHYGDTVVVKRAAGVIPKVAAAVAELRPESAVPVTMPQTCPSCGEALTRPEGLAGTFCENRACPERVTASLQHAATKDVLNILGLGDAIVQALRERGVTHYSELYELSADDLAALQLAPAAAGKTGRLLGTKTATKLHEQIQATRNASLEAHLKALDIPMLGRGTAERLAPHFASLSAFRDAALGEGGQTLLEDIKDIGPDTAHSLISGLQAGASARIDHLAALGVHGAPSEKLRRSDTLADLNICVTGKLSRGRDEVQTWLASHGATISKSVTKTISHLLAGEDAGSKIAKAQGYKGVTIISESEISGLCTARGLTWLN